MAGLTVAHRVAMTALIEQAPDAMLGTLTTAIAGLKGAGAGQSRGHRRQLHQHVVVRLLDQSGHGGAMGDGQPGHSSTSKPVKRPAADMLPGSGLTSAIRRTCQASAAGSSSTALSPPSSLSESEIRPP